MSLDPLLQAVSPIPLHAFATMAAFVLGVVQIAAPKGTLPHRTLGWIWVILMLTVAISAFWIHGHNFRIWRGFGPIHFLAVLVLVMVPIGVWRARRHQVDAHRWTMISIFTGALVIAGVFTLVPGRIMHTVVFGP
jgi:uncharacterized membrane protein